jgi:hypothetical protein
MCALIYAFKISTIQKLEGFYTKALKFSGHSFRFIHTIIEQLWPYNPHSTLIYNLKKDQRIKIMKEAVTEVTGKRIFTDHWVEIKHL